MDFYNCLSYCIFATVFLQSTLKTALLHRLSLCFAQSIIVCASHNVSNFDCFCPFPFGIFPTFYASKIISDISFYPSAWDIPFFYTSKNHRLFAVILLLCLHTLSRVKNLYDFQYIRQLFKRIFANTRLLCIAYACGMHLSSCACLYARNGIFHNQTLACTYAEHL